MTVSTFRLTPADLGDLDPKTRDGLAPLLNRLNIVLQELVKAANAVEDVVTDVTPFTTDGAGAALVDIVNPLSVLPTCVLLASLSRQDGQPVDTGSDLSSWELTVSGIRLLFVGLVASTTYNFAVRVQ